MVLTYYRVNKDLQCCQNLQLDLLDPKYVVISRISKNLFRTDFPIKLSMCFNVSQPEYKRKKLRDGLMLCTLQNK